MNENVSINDVVAKLEGEMGEQVGKLKRDLGTLRTGRANPQLLEGVRVEYYGTPTPIKQVGAVAVPDARTIEVTPWDPSVLDAIFKALQIADLGAMPQNDGKCVRLSLPAMTEDRRKQLVKTVRKMAEDYKINVRNLRRDGLEIVKKALKAKAITEDDVKRLELAVQKSTDVIIKQIDGIIAEKEQELLTV
ncbi:MAG: ribosome recycling factor [Elusimicrobia bacterium]|nr:ribosome recycling factor [Elusimicrobiota bacterium]